MVNLFIVYELDVSSRDLNNDFKRLFGAVKQTDNTNPGKYKYSGYGIGFHSRSFSPLPDNTMGRNVVIF